MGVLNNQKILLVDDHPVVRSGLRRFFEAQSDSIETYEASDGSKALEIMQRHHIDLVLLDVLMPGKLGHEVCLEIKESFPETKIIGLSSSEDPSLLASMFRNGASAYLFKDVATTKLLEVAELVLGGEIYVEPKVGKLLVEAGMRTVASPTAEIHQKLSEREVEVLLHIAAGKSNLDIADQLFLTETTVKSHVSNILAKLGLSTRTQAAVMAWKTGIIK